MEKIKVTLSPSTINLIQSCWRKFDYEKNQGYGPKIKTTALDTGELFHHILASYYNGKMISRENNITASINEGRIHGLKLNLSAAEIEDTIIICQHYFMYYKDESWVPLAVEKPFTVEFYETEHYVFFLEGKLDLLVQNDKEVMIVDHKSKAKKSYPLTLNNQYYAYCWALGMDKLVENVLYKQKTMDGSKMTYADRFPRRIMSYNQEQLDEWYDEMKELCDQYENNHRRNYFPANYTKCWDCSFNQVCSSLRDVRSYVLERDYKKLEAYDIFKSK